MKRDLAAALMMIEDLRAALLLHREWERHDDVKGALVMASIHGYAGSDDVRALCKRAWDASDAALSSPDGGGKDDKRCKVCGHKIADPAAKYWEESK